MKIILSMVFGILSVGIIGFSEAYAEDLEFNLLNIFDLVNQNDQIVRPTDMHLDDSGFLYTVQHFTGIHVFDSSKNLVLFIDGQNSEINPHSGLNGIAADSLGNIYLAESTGARTLVFNPDGDFVTTITTPQIRNPFDVEVAFDGTVYVTDTNAVFSFDENYTPIASFGVQSWINVIDSGHIQALSVFKPVITTYDKNGLVQNIVTLESIPGNTFTNYRNFDTDSNGNFFISGNGNFDGSIQYCILMYDQSGIYLDRFCENTVDQFGLYSFTYIADILVQNDDSFLVSSNGNLREFTFDNVYCGKLGDAYDNIIIGTENDDVLTGTKKSDAIIGLGGNDNIKGKKGNDCLLGGLGNDDIRGGSGADLIDAGSDDDVVKGDKGDDTIFGGIGIDTIFGGSGNYMLYGNDGFDTINGQSGNDFIFGNNGDDLLNGNKGNDVLEGNNGNDLLNGGNDDDTLFGGVGSDDLQGKKGIDACEFGLGNTINCELVTPLIADLTLFLGTDVEYVSPGDLLELELEVHPHFTTTLIENIQVLIISR